MDVKGAKALKQRLGSRLADEVPSASTHVPDAASPVYRWVGVKQEAPETPAAEDDEPPTTSLFRRLGLSLR